MGEQSEQILRTQLKLIPGMRTSEVDALIAAGLKDPKDIIKEPFSKLVNNEPKLHIEHLPAPEVSWETANKMALMLPAGMRVLGSYRRCSSIVHDIDVLTCMPMEEGEKILESLFTILGRFIEGDRRRAYIIKFDGINIRTDLFHAKYDELPFAILHYSGSAAFNIRIRAHARRSGYKLSQYSLIKDGKKIPCKNEKEILKIIGVTYKEPKDRDK